MIYFVKRIPTEDLYIVHKEEFSITCDTYSWKRRSLIIRDNPILSLERTVDKDYNHKGSIAKKNVVSLIELGAKTNWMAGNRQSWSNFDFELSQLSWVSCDHEELRDIRQPVSAWVQKLKNIVGNCFQATTNEDI
jgi:hypothetical protein